MAHVLILCERSGAIRNAFARLGHTVVSVDTLPSTTPCEGDSQHIVADALDFLPGGPQGAHWDIVIARPPCTFMANSGARWLLEKDKTTGELTQRAKDRWVSLAAAIDFFKAMQTMDSDLIAIENPIPHKHARLGFENEYASRTSGIGEPTQYVQPWDFGHPESKKTGWWLKGLPLLQGTKDVKAEAMALPYAERNRVHHASPGPERWMKRSLLVDGMAAAIADQWGSVANRATTKA
jgi:hypothetical protein